MIVEIKETGKKENLGIYDGNGINYATDFVGNSGFKREFNDDREELMSQADFDWWAAVCGTHDHIGDVCRELSDVHDDDREALYQSIIDATSDDLDSFTSADTFDTWFSGICEQNGYKMTVYSDGSIGFELM